MVERIAFRGRMAADCTNMSMEDYLKLIKSRQRRSIKRNAPEYKDLLQKVEGYKKAGKIKAVRTHLREAVIIPQWIGLKFEVYNGKVYQPLDITAGMLGHRLGEFSFSTKRVQHSAPGIRATKGSKFLAVK